MTPLESFNRFLELTPDMPTVFSQKEDDFLELIDAFLANPGQHRDHVRLICEAAFAVKLLEQVPILNLYKWWWYPFAKIIRHGFSDKYLERVARLKASLLETAQPGEFGVDVSGPQYCQTTWTIRSRRTRTFR